MKTAKPPPQRDDAAFWPCIPVPDEDAAGQIRSIIFTEFELLDRTYPRATSGYAIEGLVRKLARAEKPGLLRRVKFDPERDMFAAYGDDVKALLEIARLLRKATGQKRPKIQAAAAKLSPEEASELLCRGFIAALDP